jgi:hypothetical protein
MAHHLGSWIVAMAVVFLAFGMLLWAKHQEPKDPHA